MNIFEEPSDPTPEPTFTSYKGVELRLITEHSLWGHVLWNAAKVLADLIRSNVIAVRGRSVLELGAGAALPSIQASLQGARTVVATDYPEEALLDNIQFNASQNKAIVEAKPLLWGDALPDKFDLIFLSDLVFNHTEHLNLVRSMVSAMHESTQVHCLFSHHLPHKKEKDRAFLEACRAEGLECRENEPICMGRMFPEDDVQFENYDLRDRELVFWWVITK